MLVSTTHQGARSRMRGFKFKNISQNLVHVSVFFPLLSPSSPFFPLLSSFLGISLKTFYRKSYVKVQLKDIGLTKEERQFQDKKCSLKVNLMYSPTKRYSQRNWKRQSIDFLHSPRAKMITSFGSQEVDNMK